MKIIAIKPFLVHRYLLVRVYTDEGIVGNGEAGLWAYHETVAREIERLAEYFVGKDPARIEHHHQVATRQWHFMDSVCSAALSAIDVALWDIAGKVAGLPVHRLLGGRCRDRIKVFESIRGATPVEQAEDARRLVEAGFKSLRTEPFPRGWQAEVSSARVIETAVDIVSHVREAIGPTVDLGLEIHRFLALDEAITLGRELEPFRLQYYEDPLPPENTNALEYLSRHLSIPLAAGERNFNIHQFSELLDRGIVSFIRADLSLAGGITQCRKIAAMAEAHLVRHFPHLVGSPVNTMAYLQLAAAIPNYFVQEANIPTGPALEIVDWVPEVVDGHIAVHDRPGIGIEIDEKVLSRFPFEPVRIAGNFNADGSVRH